VTILSVDERLGNRADAEDLLQVAMEKVVSRRGSLRRADKLVAWFYRLLRKLLVDWYRRQAVQRGMLSRLAASEPSHRAGRCPLLRGVARGGKSETFDGALNEMALRGFVWVKESGLRCGNPLWERVEARLSQGGNLA
jgi:RNA polymerase sigma factor (sigma-70 family)